MNVPTTCAELEAAANLPFNEGNGLISRADKTLVVQCFSRIYPNFGFGYLHSSDHYAALKILLEREPTFREVYDSYHGGSRNIDAARDKAGGGLRPTDWDIWTPEQRRLNVLVHLNGITRGSKIFDGKRPDPDPEKTRNLLLLWGGVSDLPSDPPAPPTPPVTPEPPKTEPTKPVRISVKGEVVITGEDGTERRIPFTGTGQ
ncbi:MAG TPA: hypothetical protein VF414_01790 [Thermoanaerobaculia bacterium]